VGGGRKCIDGLLKSRLVFKEEIKHLERAGLLLDFLLLLTFRLAILKRESTRYFQFK